jgi:hypothetical protein
MSDIDRPYKYTDNQNNDFVVVAGSEAEAWRLARHTIEAHDREYQSEQQARQAKQEILYGEVLSGDWRNDRIDRIIEDGHADLIRKHNAQISAGAGNNGLHGSLARDYCLPDNGSYTTCTAQPGGGSQSTSSSASTEPKEGLTCSGFLAVAVMLFILCGLASGCVAWLEEIAP